MVHPKLYSLHWKGLFFLFFFSLPKFVPEARGMCMVPTRSSNQFPAGNMRQINATNKPFKYRFETF